MSELGHHLVLRLSDGRVLAPSAAERRCLTATIAGVGRRFGVIAWDGIDEHEHVIALVPRAQAGELARRTEHALRFRLSHGVPFAPARITPIRDQGHLQASLGYLARQQTRHRATTDPRREQSSLPDVLGLRVVAPWLAHALAVHAPRFDARVIAAEVGLAVRLDPLEPGEPASQAIATAPPGRHGMLADAAAAAVSLDALQGNGPAVVAARTAAVQVAGWLATEVLADVLRCSVRTVRRLRCALADPALKRAVCGQLRLRVAR
jgi:hypothetical protein